MDVDKRQMNPTLEYILKKFNPVMQEGRTELRNINRTIMAQTLGELGFTKGAEIGVAEGYHARVLCEAIKGLTLYAVDCWEEYEGYSEYKNIDIVYQEAKKNLAPYDVKIIKAYSTDAVKECADNSLDFVYIDSGHDFKNVANDIHDWTRKVRVGGVVFGHDYKQHGAYIDKGRQRHPVHVKSVVDAYVKSFEISPLFILTNDVRDPTFGRDNAGWAFVKQ